MRLVCSCGGRTFQILCDMWVRVCGTQYLAPVANKNFHRIRLPHSAGRRFLSILWFHFFLRRRETKWGWTTEDGNGQKKRFESKEFEAQAFQLSSIFCFEDCDFPFRSVRWRSFVFICLGPSIFAQFNQCHSVTAHDTQPSVQKPNIKEGRVRCNGIVIRNELCFLNWILEWPAAAVDQDTRLSSYTRTLCTHQMRLYDSTNILKLELFCRWSPLRTCRNWNFIRNDINWHLHTPYAVKISEARRQRSRRQMAQLDGWDRIGRKRISCVFDDNVAVTAAMAVKSKRKMMGNTAEKPEKNHRKHTPCHASFIVIN